MKYYSLLLTAFLVLNACSSSKNWKGTSTFQGTQAEFEELNGKQAFTIQVPDNDTYLKYQFTVNSGKLAAIIKSPTQIMLSKELAHTERDSIHLLNQKGTEYRIYLEGKQAKGGFDISFTNSPH